MAVQLTETEVTGLRWMIRCNREGVGFLGPSVWRSGPLDEYDRLEKLGMARCISFAGHGNKRGYWILPDGRRALSYLKGDE